MAVASIVLAAVVWTLVPTGKVDPNDPAQVALGKTLYGRECAACHGDQLQGQPGWQRPKANGMLPAPPHDATGHTWHHGNDALFQIVKEGVEPFAPPGYRSEMPAFGGRLSDAEIWAVLSYIESTWPDSIRAARARHLSAGH